MELMISNMWCNNVGIVLVFVVVLYCTPRCGRVHCLPFNVLLKKKLLKCYELVVDMTIT